ncbi:MAG: diguanylate cyclase [Candidatus Omnitrophota bacterium]
MWTIIKGRWPLLEICSLAALVVSYLFLRKREREFQREVAEGKRAGAISEGLRAVVAISDELIACPDVDTIFKKAVEFARSKLGIERCVIFLEEDGYMVGTYGTDRHGNTTDEHAQRFPKDKTWDERCRMLDFHTPQWFVAEEPHREWRGKEAAEIGRGWIVTTPIQSAHKSIGVFVNDAAISKAPLVSMKQDILAVFCSMLGSITERKRMEKERELLNKKLESLAVRDSHTGLYNHRYLMEIIEAEFERAARYSYPISVLMLDIDYFKSINDVYGHQFGDLVLKQLAQELKKIVRRYDVVIRFGGEEFIIVSPGTDDQRAMALAQRILETVNLHYFGDPEHSVKLKLTIAISSYPEDKVARGIDLIGIADQILNKAKEDGGNRAYSSVDMKKQRPIVAQQDSPASAEVNSLKAKIEKLTKRANQSLMEAVFAFAKTIELKDHHTAEHAEKVVHYAVEIAKALGLSREQTECIRQACILHDLGKIGTSEQILLKSSMLTGQEFAEIKKHPQIGADIIRPLHFLRNIIPFILYHHERWDGNGYPNGLKGENIPLGARIVAIADVFEALTSQRAYRKAYSREEALKIIKEGSGTQFDPRIVNIFFKILQDEK